jgi:hypothetical protein
VIDHYDWAGGREAMLRFGPDHGPVVVLAMPLFEEANRTRAFAVMLLRLLGDQGIAGVLPDIPGQGESLTPLEQTTILDMQCAYDNLVQHLEREGRKCFGAAIRSGALLDALGLLFGRWHFAPQGGPDLLAELTRIKQIELGGKQPLSSLWYFDGCLSDERPDPPAEIAGNLLSVDLLTELTVKEPFNEEGIPRRVVRLESDPREADLKVAGAPLWRRSEPDNDPALAATLAADLAQWVRQCAG